MEKLEFGLSLAVALTLLAPIGCVSVKFTESITLPPRRWGAAKRCSIRQVWIELSNCSPLYLMHREAWFCLYWRGNKAIKEGIIWQNTTGDWGRGSAAHRVHTLQYTAHCTALYSTIHCTLHTALHITIHLKLHCTLNSAPFNTHNTLSLHYTVQYTAHNTVPLQCTVQYTAYCRHTVQYTAQCTALKLLLESTSFTTFLLYLPIAEFQR